MAVMSPDTPAEEVRGMELAEQILTTRWWLSAEQMRRQSEIIYQGLCRRGLGDRANGFREMGYIISRTRHSERREPEQLRLAI
jgi:hypothetical protein